MQYMVTKRAKKLIMYINIKAGLGLWSAVYAVFMLSMSYERGLDSACFNNISSEYEKDSSDLKKLAMEVGKEKGLGFRVYIL